MKKLRVFEAFAGIGSQQRALHNLHLQNPNYYNYEISNISEWDTFSLITKMLINNIGGGDRWNIC